MKKSFPDQYTFYTNDFTGDGIDDFGTAKTTGPSTNRDMNFVRIYKGSNPLTAFNDSITINPYTGYSKINSSGKFLYAGDFNGDGIGDFLSMLGVTSNPSSIGIHLYFGNISSSFGTVGTTGTINIPVNNWPGADRIQILDFNGDGKSDLMVTKDSYTEIFTFDSYVARSIYYAGFPTKWHLPFFADFNGDRKMDILCRTSLTDNNAPWYKAISTSVTFNQSAITFNHIPTINAEYAGDKMVMLDANGDGKSDIFHGWDNGSLSNLDVYYSRGNDFLFTQSSYQYNLNTTALTAYDINGDGKSEVITQINYVSPLAILYFKKDGKELYLDKIKNGYDHNTQFVYRRINETGTFYTRGSIVSGNINNIQLPLTLVSELITDNGIGSTDNIIYNYEEAKIHKEGKGLLGFKKVYSKNLTTGFKTIVENEFNTTYFTAALLKSRIEYSPTSTLINEITNSNQFLAQGTGRYWYRVNSTTENKALEGQTVTSTNNTFDIYGNVTLHTLNANSVETKTTTSVYGQYGTPVPAMPTSVTVSNTRTGQSAFSTISTMTYNALGQVTSKVDFSGQPKAVTTTLTYNNLGNQTSARLSASGIVSRNIFSSQFDAKGRWATSTITPVGTTSTTYHSLWGKPLNHTNIEGLATSYTYDAFGRELTMVAPQFYTISSSYAFTTDYGTRHYKLITHPGKPDVKVYFDKLDRERRTLTEGWQNLWITTEKTYHFKGNIGTITGPYKTGETGQLTTFNYDEYNRVSSQVVNMGGTNYTTTFGYSYSGGNLTTTTTNPASQVSSKVTDATGKTISATDYGGTLNYTYYSHGGLKTVINGTTTLVTNYYDAYARQNNLIDINAGAITYDYDALGQLISQMNAKSQLHTMTYDTLGRIVTKVMPEGTSTYEYYGPGTYASIAKLKKITGFAGNLEEYTYDGFGRVNIIKETVDGTAHYKTLAYNSYDDVTSVNYPSGFKLNYTYDANAYLNTIKNTDNSFTLFTNGTMNGYNQYKTYNLGNTLSSTNTYFYGIPTNYTTGSVQNLTLNWNYYNGNLTSRVDGVVGKTETFTYDNLNRLLTTAVTGLSTYTMTYAANGNVSTKTDAGTYTYGLSRINAVSQINPSASNISGNIQSLPTYTSFLQPATISENNYSLAYTYAEDENRIKGVLTQSGSTLNTRYFFGDYEKDITGTNTKHLHYVSAGDGLIAIVIRENGTDSYYYTYTDHLGSILTVTNNAGAIIASQNFDAWGRFRNTSTWNYTGVTAPSAWLTRGYTGHEHLTQFALINMNGRLYDPMVGRMLSPDNNIQAPGYTQNYNRYSYALNNPLKYNDPDGEFVELVIGALIGVATNGINNVLNGHNFFQGAFKSALFGAIGGGVSNLIGNAASAITNGFERAVFQVYAHGFSGSALSLAQGGNSVAGFLSGAISSGIGSGIGAIGMGNTLTGLSQLLGGGLSGGISGVLGGGKFWEGARQGLITGTLNHSTHYLFYSDPPFEYNGKQYHSKSELYSAILFEQAQEQLGIKDILALGVALDGLGSKTKRFVTPGSSKRTSYLSEFLGDKLGKSPSRLPTLTSKGLRYTTSIGRFTARTVPLLGWGLLAYDSYKIIVKSNEIYSLIINKK